MPAVISEKGKEMLEMLPPYLQDDPAVQTVIDVQAREYQRIEETANLIRSKMMPQNADDTYDLLALWETFLDLPANPSGVSIEARRAKVLVAFKKIASGADWVIALTQAIGTDSWTHTEGPGAYVVIIEQPHPLGSYQAEVVARLARRITPAHLFVSVTDGDGFIVGTSIVGTDLV